MEKKPKPEVCVKGICEAMTEFCKKIGCPDIKDMTDVDGFVLMFFRSNGHCRIHTAGHLDIGNVYLASKEALKQMLKEIEGERPTYAA